MFVLMFIVLLVATETSVWAACLDGFVPWRGPDSDEFAINSKGACMPLCSNGHGLNLSNGVSFKLFADKTTTPSLNIMTDSMTCYADAVSGSGAGLNMSDGKQTWHLYTPIPCSTKYTVSYSCGTGATGNAPDARIIDYGALLGLGYDYGTCYRKGYYANGWYLDGVVKSPGTYVPYDYYADKTLTIRWWPSTFVAVYLCNTHEANNMYSSATYGNRFTPIQTPCAPPCGKKLVGFDIQDYDGSDLGRRLSVGESFVWDFENSIRLSAVWENDDTPIQTYTLSYSCGTGATGTPPPSRTVKYGNLYTPGTDIGTCARAGYVFDGWVIESYARTDTKYYPYTYILNRELVAQWTRPSYGAAYICNNGTTNSSYISGYMGNSYKPSTTVCTAPDGMTFAGYAVQDAYGVDTGDVIAPGASFTWTYDNNIRLSAIWN